MGLIYLFTYLFNAVGIIAKLLWQLYDTHKYRVIQEEMLIISGSHIIGHCEKKNLHKNMILIPNGYRDRAVWIYKYKSSGSCNKLNPFKDEAQTALFKDPVRTAL